MRNVLALTALVLVAAATGCQAPNEAKAPQESLDALLVASIHDPQIDNAIVVQHTIYPYHFVPDGADLNELGERDLRVLADHFKNTSGELNVNRGPASDELYAARVAAVIASLGRAGVGAERVQVVDKLPGGEGVSTDRVIKILAAASQAPAGASGGMSTGAAVWTGTK